MGDRLISAEDASKFAAEGAMLLDVRKPIEVVEGTENKTTFTAIIEPLDDWVREGTPTAAIKIAAEFGKKILVLCTNGSKSALAWEFLKQHGIDAYLIDGGFEAWEKGGHKTQVMKFFKYDLYERRARGRR